MSTFISTLFLEISKFIHFYNAALIVSETEKENFSKRNRKAFQAKILLYAGINIANLALAPYSIAIT
jgi:hypothetical protein